jgi:PKD repeat protein
MKNISNKILLLILLFVGIQKVEAGEQGCYADFNYTIDYSVSSLTYLFADQSNSNSTIVSWDWNFGDGSLSSFQNPEHQYLSEGTYLVSLSITCSDGSSDSITDTIKVAKVIPPSCSAYYTYNADSANPLIYHFTDHSLSQNDTIIAWQWNFGDMTTGSTQQNPIHQYAAIGTYYVSLSISTSGGHSAIYSDSISVINTLPNCNASFSYKADSVSGNPKAIFFYDQSTSADPIISWRWDFADGDSSLNQNPAHIFPYAGIYDVSLRIKTQNGCSSTTHYPIQVGNPQRYNIWGRVYLGNQTTDKCIAYIYKEFNNGYIVPVDTVRLTSVNDTLGVYYFYQVLEGIHKIKVLLPSNSNYYHQYAPTYYGNNLFWNNTSSISLFQDVSLANVELAAVNQQVGTNKISGAVMKYGNQIYKSGIQVLLIGPSQEVFDYTYTDNMGEYRFDDVPSGPFYVYAEVTGLYAVPAYMNLQTYDTLNNVNIYINTTQTVASIDESIIKKDIPSIKTYPNPVSNIMHLEFNQETNQVVYYEIVNNIGQIVMEGKFEYATKRTNLDLSELDPGFYIIHLKSIKGESTVNKKFIKL